MAYANTSLRGASLALSAALLGALLIGAMSLRFTMMQNDAPPDFRAVELVRPPLPPPPQQPQTRPRETPPPADDQIVISDAPAPIETAEAPVLTTQPVFGPPVLSEITDPRWMRRPRDLSRFYPARARGAGIEGEVTLDCTVSAQGSLACAVTRETPPGWGFRSGAAHRAGTPHGSGHTRRPAGRGRYRMRLPFNWIDWRGSKFGRDRLAHGRARAMLDADPNKGRRDLMRLLIGAGRGFLMAAPAAAQDTAQPALESRCGALPATRRPSPMAPAPTAPRWSAARKPTRPGAPRSTPCSRAATRK